ncbi:MAG: hypothetical protein ACE15E_04715 [Acidobacteriota bacterium]
MKSPKKLMTLSVMTFALFLPGCSESGMRADQEQAEVPAGTQLYVRVNQNLPSESQGWKSGDEFQGTLARVLQLNGRVIAPEGTIVKGELTNRLDTGAAPGTDTRTGETAMPQGRRTEDQARPGTDRGATGDATKSGSRADQNRMGLELKKIVLNGEEYDIDTHTVPVPGMTAEGQTEATKGKSQTGRGADQETMAKTQIAGQEFVFTLEDKVDLPSTTNMKTE